MSNVCGTKTTWWPCTLWHWNQLKCLLIDILVEYILSIVFINSRRIILRNQCQGCKHFSVADPGFPRPGANSKGGSQPTIWPIFPEKCMKWNNFGGEGGEGIPATTLDPPMLLKAITRSWKKHHVQLTVDQVSFLPVLFHFREVLVHQEDFHTRDAHSSNCYYSW